MSDMLEDNGVIGPQDGSRPRAVIEEHPSSADTTQDVSDDTTEEETASTNDQDDSPEDELPSEKDEPYDDEDEDKRKS
jgi:hypothetical protein